MTHQPSPTMVAIARDYIEREEAAGGPMNDAERRRFLTDRTEWPAKNVAILVAAVRLDRATCTYPACDCTLESVARQCPEETPPGLRR